ncbi:aldo/keto reductase [Kitasatospora sp. NPDC127059]|uniref:aldo/keto reductase n=1 Tax=unclassified Kitasatospora TaxID=2633591 RepID=UPI0036503288
MHNRQLGPTGLAVGAIGLGCMGMTAFYTTGGYDEAASVEVVHRALDQGITLIDTADVYGPFTNEELLGRALADRRERAVLATKVGLVMEPDRPMYRNGRPEHIHASIRASLKRLGTDHVDLYYLHRVDPDVPLAESWGAMAELVEAGLVRGIGLSEVGIEELETAQTVHPVAAVQTELSLWSREALADVLPWCSAHGAAFVPYSPLGRGFLTGGYTSPDAFAPDDYRTANPRFAREAFAANLAIVETLRRVADRHGATPGQVALAWTLAQGEQVVPIPGTKRPGHLAENAGAADLRLSDADLTELDSAPAPVGSRY